MELLQIIWNKKSSLILSFILCLMFTGCNNPNKQNTNIASNDSICIETINKEETSAFSPVLLKEILQCISDTNHLMQSDIYDLWFAKTNGDCCIAINKTICYDSKLAEGFYLIDDKLIVYFGTNVTCGAILEGRIDPYINRNNKIECDIASLIDTTLLLKECPAGFPDENSDEALYTLFDPYGKIFKVHNCDSLELIYEGGL